MNLPNKLTILRVIMIPFFVVFMYLDFAAAKWIALGIFIAAAIIIVENVDCQRKLIIFDSI